MSHYYEKNAYTVEQIAKMQSTNSPTIVVEDFISQDEFVELRSMIDTIEYPEHGKISKYSGSAYEHEPHGPRIKELLHTKLQDYIGNYQLDFFAWQEAIIPWNIHADLRWYADKIPHKVILIPLDVIDETGEWATTYSLTFKQRNYLRSFGKRFQEKSKLGNHKQKWLRPIDHPNVEGCIEGYSIDKETWREYLSHIPYENIEGLEIDKIYKWEPGSTVIWDANQLHCADNFLARNLKTKRSMVIHTNQF